MKRTLLALLLAAAPLAAQEPHPQGPPPNGPERRGPGGPGRPDERVFVYGQMFRAIDEKATILIEQGKPEAAAKELERALSVDVPREHPIYEAKAHLVGRLAATYAQIGRKKDAVETIQKLLTEVPPGSVAEASAWLDAGTIYKQAGMADEALKAFDRAIELSQKLAKSPPRGPAGRPGPPPPRSPQ